MRGYSEGMAAQPVMTAEELIERVRQAAPPTPDDVTILWDGRRLDSREAVMEWLTEVAAKRAEEAIGAASGQGSAIGHRSRAGDRCVGPGSGVDRL